jgi:hypothetical protein
MFDADLTYTHMSPYTESGAGALDVSYKATDKVTPALSPTLEIGTRVGNARFIGRLYTDIGMTWFVSPTWQQEGSFVGLPNMPFYTTTDVPALVGRLTVGAQLYAWNNIAVQAEYNGTYAPAYTENAGTIRLDYRF